MGDPAMGEVRPTPFEGGEAGFVEQVSEVPKEPSPRGPFAAVGAALDTLLTEPESRGWFIASLVLALFLYLITWFLNDAWYFAATKWAEARGQVATATMTISPTPFSSSTVLISPTVSLVLTSSSPPALFCGGMACGAAIVLAIVLIIHGLVKE
jgi:hypothetical protein